MDLLGEAHLLSGNINPDIINNTKLIIPFTEIIEYPKSNPINFLV